MQESVAVRCKRKGSTEHWVIDQMVKNSRRFDRDERIIVEAGDATPLTEMQRVVAKARAGYGTAVEQSRVGDSNSNGRGGEVHPRFPRTD